MAATRIAVIGGGPGGLTLARLLQTRFRQTQTVDVTVYESDTNENARSQGGSLDLHADTGLHAIEQAGLMNEFRKFARQEGEAMKIVDNKNFVFFERKADREAGDPLECPEIDRGDLRKILLASLRPSTVRWGHKLRSVSPVGDSFQLLFESGAKTDTDVVVGADGAWSRVRPLLSSVKPKYSGVTSFDLPLSNVDTRLPAVANLVGSGMLMALGNNRGFVATRNSGGNVLVYAMVRVHERWLEDEARVPLDRAIEARQRILEFYHGWDDSLLELIRGADEKGMTARKIFELPMGLSWTARKGITLLGDAAHLMQPNGEGVNLAMRDAVDLADALVAGTRDFTAYEATMIERASVAGTAAANVNLDTMISPDGAQGLINSMTGGSQQ